MAVESANVVGYQTITLKAHKMAMKKLMIALAAVATAMFAQAASVSWSVDLGLQDANFTDVEGTVAFYLTSDLSSPLASSPFDIQAGGSVSGTVTGEDQKSWTARITITNFDEGGSFYTDYVFDMDTMAHPNYADANTYLVGLGAEVTSAFLKDYSLDLTASAASQGFTAAVPEPTSGLLILLGMAELALKRKRA